MWIEWTMTGLSAAGILAWCRARSAERTILAHYPATTRWRIHLPLFPWRDQVAKSDHAALWPIRIRAVIGTGLLICLPLLVFVFGREPVAGDPIRPRVRTSNPVPEAETIMEPESTSGPPQIDIETPLPPQIETLEELRSPIRLYGTAKVQPVYRVHDVEGARITHIAPDSFWAVLGVQEGDVVIELHGEPIDNPAALVALMNVLERDEHIALRVRGTDGEVRYLEFRIPDEP